MLFRIRYKDYEDLKTQTLKEYLKHECTRFTSSADVGG